ncbi:hypothetical protein AJ80_05409 [Polytolypa hystricis UAMH7299]|uniref:alpha-1,2-Mannosidase n=1 Tax=Polytolypa hystricis (strain UAMH7299) TaxID=1447883 RepID=A0A2B7Y4U7_POLH7|nr:hypothetical protein AJ80_05409 [Polytolypa hystricis UAMH7299]
MAFQLPNNVPSFSSSQRTLENEYWRAANRYGNDGGFDFSTTVNSLMGADQDLPMYKDKPYYSKQRSRTMPRRRRTLLGLTATVVFLGTIWFLLSGKSPQQLIGQHVGSMHGGELFRWRQGIDKKAPSLGSHKEIDWAERRERVRDAFVVSWDDYAQHGWGKDIYKPISQKGADMVKGGMGWMIVDALDTLMIMNLTSRVQHARDWIHTSLQYTQDKPVNTFETTIRMLGGLLSAHYLSTTYPDLASIPDDDAGAHGEDLYIEKATDLADRLLHAFDSKSGIPFASVNLNTSASVPSHADNGASSTAEAATLQLEFKYLAKLTGETNYWETVEKVMEVIEANEREDGLLPIFIYPDTGKFMGDNIRLGSRGDSYYEYLIKQYLQTSEEEPIYLDLWEEALAGIRKHLITYSKHASLTVLGERPRGLRGDLAPKMDHLVCFMPGTIALAATGGQPISKARKQPGWGRKQEEEILLAKELMKTCWATYLATNTGLAPEITYFEIDDPPRMMSDVLPFAENKKKSGADSELHMISKPLYPLDKKRNIWRKDIDIHAQDKHNLQRPETVESLFYMYRILEDDAYRHWGWEMFRNFVKHTAVIEETSSSSSEFSDADGGQTSSRIRGFTSLNNVDVVPPVQRDNMESFWLAETLKYFYLLFSDRDFLPLEKTVFNTEAHVFPRFNMGSQFKTGWTRKHKWKKD